MWASACLSGADILCNEITLEVIKAYKAAGYQPVRMDGNPPDYIGEQFRFLEYLAKCGKDEEETAGRPGKDGGESADREIQEFIDHFVMKLRMVRFLRTPEYDALFSGVIHAIYLVLFYYCISYVFKVNPPTKLNLAEDEQMILNEMLAGKKQKEIDLYSQQTITAKLKTMRERNMCDSTSTLLARYAVEKESGLKINSSSDSSND